MTKPKVYVVQKQQRFDARSGDLVPRYDTINRAAQYGEMEYLLSPTAGPFRSESIIAELKEKLKNFTDQDYLVLIGNPCLIGWAVAIAAQRSGGKVNLLQWSGRNDSYVEIRSQGLTDWISVG